ncbi:MAG: hypothetical protein OZ923_01460 [Comamonadaceae bacterium]|nr:hypothetical protein [Comamonadaceae bacterium]
MKISSKTLTASLGAVALAFAASGVQAESVSVGASSQPYGHESVNVTGYNGSAGQFKFGITSADGPTYSVPGTILSFCVELTEFVQSSATYKVLKEGDVGGFSAAVYSNLTNLFNKYWNAVTSTATSAAMQLAVWEIVYDGSNLDLSDGSFKVTSAGGGAKGIAQGWLNNLNNPNVADTGNFSVIKLSAKGAQDQVTVGVNTVPLPGAALLFLSALGLGGLARRKQAVQAPAAA